MIQVSKRLQITVSLQAKPCRDICRLKSESTTTTNQCNNITLEFQKVIKTSLKMFLNVHACKNPER